MLAAIRTSANNRVIVGTPKRPQDVDIAVASRVTAYVDVDPTSARARALPRWAAVVVAAVSCSHVWASCSTDSPSDSMAVAGQTAGGSNAVGSAAASAGSLASVAGQTAAGSIAAGAGAATPKAGASGASVSGSAGSAGASVAGASAAGTGANAGSNAAASMRCPVGPFGVPVPAGASAVRVDGVPPQDAFNDNGNLRTNIEGPVWIAGKLYFSEFPFNPAPKSRILAFDPAGSGGNAVTIALASSGSNGLAVDLSGALVATNHELGAIVRMTLPLTTSEVLVGDYEGKRFNSPNDLAIRSDGTIYFSDPDYQAPTSHPQTKTRLYRIPPGAKQASMIDDTRSQPNGVTLSADENTLYVSGADGIYSYPVSASGEIAPGSGKRINTFGGSADGLGMDCAGNLYATSGQRIVVLDPSGKEVGTIAVSQAESVTNVAFGGADRKTLFITSMGTGNQRGLFRIELNVPGLPD